MYFLKYAHYFHKSVCAGKANAFCFLEAVSLFIELHMIHHEMNSKVLDAAARGTPH